MSLASTELSSELLQRMSILRLLVCDVDGVLTDGRLNYSDGGESVKTFHVHDGLGLQMLQAIGVEVAIITARSGAAVSKRMSDLKISHVQQGRGDKGAALSELLEKLGVKAEEVAYIGDDVLDLPAMKMVGVSATVADGHSLVCEQADWRSSKGGGHGAVRELCDTIAAAKVGLPQAVQAYLDQRKK